MTNQTRPINKLFFYPALGAGLLTALFLSVESYLQLQGSSLCKTSACEIVGNYLLISEQILVAGGAVFFWILTLLFFFSQRYPKHISIFPFLFLATALAFDGALLGFQYFTIGQKCVLCIAIAAALLLVTTLFCLAWRQIAVLPILLLAWIGGFSANSIMDMPEPSGAASQMVFYRQPATVTQVEKSAQKTLIFSMNCPHCLEVVEKLSELNPQTDTWQLAAIDQDKGALMKLSKFVDQTSQTNNPFQLLKEVKEEETTNYKVKKGLSKQNKKALSFLANLNINVIPVLFIEESKSKKRIITGKKAILEHVVKLPVNSNQKSHL